MSIILDDLVVAVEDSEFVNADEIPEPPVGTLYRGTFGRFTIEHAEMERLGVTIDEQEAR